MWQQLCLRDVKQASHLEALIWLNLPVFSGGSDQIDTDFQKRKKKKVLPKVTQRPTELRSLLKPLSPTTASPSLLPRFPLVHSMLSLPFLNDPPVCQSTVRLQQQPCRSIAGEGCRSDASMLGSRLPGTEASCT